MKSDFNLFVKGNLGIIPGLPSVDHRYDPPESYKVSNLALDAFLYKNGYPMDEMTDPYLYNKGRKEFEKYVDEVYTPTFNKYMKEYMGYTYDEYISKLAEIDNDIAFLEASIYSYEQQIKVFPYLEIKESTSYIKYADKYSEQSFNERIKKEPSQILPFGRYDDVLIYCTSEDRIMYLYLYDTQGKDAAVKYLDAIEDKLNQAKGKAEADKFIASISKNGKIDRNAWTGALTAGKGILGGIETFVVGVGNLFSSEGMISSNQYAQMYILDALGKQGIMDDSYQLGTSFGNMLPSILISILAKPIGGDIWASAIGSASMGVSAAGNAKNQALITGSDAFISTLYGLCIGVSETTLGLLLGNIPYLNSNAKLCIKGLLSEGTEEMLQTFVEAGLGSILLGKEINMSELVGDAGKSFVYGVIMSSFATSGLLTINITLNGSKAQITNINDFLDMYTILNSGKVCIQKIDGKDVFVLDTNISNETINKIKQIFPKSIIARKSKDGKTLTIIYNNIDNNDADNNTINNNISIKEINTIEKNYNLSNEVAKEIYNIMIKNNVNSSEALVIYSLELINNGRSIPVEIISETTALLVAQNVQGYTDYGKQLWINNFNKLSNEQVQMFDEYIKLITSLNYTFTTSSPNDFGSITLNTGETIEIDIYMKSETKKILLELGFSNEENIDEFVQSIFTVAPGLIGTKGNISSEELNTEIIGLVSNIFFVDNGVSNELSDIEDIAIKLFGDDLAKIDIINNPQNLEIFLNKLNKFETRIFYNYNETCIFREANLKILSDKNWMNCTIDEKIYFAKNAYNTRNYIRINAQKLMIGNNDLPSTGTNSLMEFFEGAIIYRMIQQPMKFKNIVNKIDCPTSILNIVNSCKDLSNRKEMFNDLKTALERNEITIEDIKNLFVLLEENSEGQDLISEAAYYLIKGSHKSNTTVNATLGIYGEYIEKEK